MKEKMMSEWQQEKVINLPDIGVKVCKANPSQIAEIAAFLQSESALIGVETIQDAINTVTEFVMGNRALVAINSENKVVSFQGLGLWPTINMCELRSAKTSNEYQRKGLNTLMKELMMAEAKAMYPNYGFVGFTEATSTSRGILDKLGYEEISMDKVASDFSILGSVCPHNGPCILRNGQECGCKVFIKE